ncbi:hypothetical protein CPB83DRAFT_879138 [Crepidotus variabilis]|uniref:Uncharacterized protein n=1 Tax=Crepidotus variabilis TaxID=179855 RepID=A0A9P6JW94_9AGAR|nr:hypothetical protein CPB83DRAFT_879138 [Crepidotus variabilis]
MTSYYPSQAGYAATQPVMYANTAGYGAQPYGVAGSYAPAGGVMMPQMAVAPTVVGGAPMVMQPSYAGGYHPHRHPYSFGNRLRRFFGLAPNINVTYKSDRSTWGFMGYSRRPRYVDARTGGEVDRQGRPVYRV